MIKIALPGSAGRMGGMLIKTIAAAQDLQLVAATDRPDSPFIGRDSGEVAHRTANGVMIGSDPATLFADSHVVIDFSSPAASLAHARLAAEQGTALVIGTTGLTADDEAQLLAAATKIPCLLCKYLGWCDPLTQLVENVARKLTDGWDIEILEAHHHHKVDAPSGTALALGRAAAKGRGVELDAIADMVRKGQTGARTAGDIGFAVLRGGDVTGEHSVIFFGDGERVEISHRATDRAIFARGALRAARFAARCARLYDMTDVLKG